MLHYNIVKLRINDHINKAMKTIITFIFCTLFFLNTSAQENTKYDKDSIPYLNTAYKPGEYLKYKVKYSIINAGYAEMRVDLEQIGHNWYYSVVAVARTTGLVGRLARVMDTYKSYIDITTGLPIRATRNIRENDYRKFNELVFDQKNSTVYSLLKGKDIKVPKGTLDVLSAFFYARKYIFKHKMKKNDVINITTYFDEELYVVKIKYVKNQRIRTKFGKIDCLKFVPVIEPGSSFKEEKDLQVWFSDDGNFIPVKIRLDMKISKIKCDINEYRGLKNSYGKPFKHK